MMTACACVRTFSLFLSVWQATSREHYKAKYIAYGMRMSYADKGVMFDPAVRLPVLFAATLCRYSLPLLFAATLCRCMQNTPESLAAEFKEVWIDDYLDTRELKNVARSSKYNIPGGKFYMLKKDHVSIDR